MPPSVTSLPWSAIGPSALLSATVGALCFAVLGPALLRTRSRDRRVAAGWMLGSSLAVGQGGFGLWLLWTATSGLDTAGALPPGWAGAAWGASTAGTALALGAGRAIAPPWPRHIAQALLLALSWVLCRASLEWGLGGHPAPTQLAWQGLLTALTLGGAMVWLTQNIHTPGRWYWRQGITPLLPGAGLGLAVALTPPAAPLIPHTDGLPVAALPWIGAGATLTLAVGVIVGLVDRLTRQRDQKLSLSLGEAHRRLREQALKDPLTGLPNRAYFDHRLKALSRTLEGKATPLAVMMVDLDGFKAINESFGHPTGDLVLKEMARRLRAEVGPSSLVARVGGDEFLVLCRRPAVDTEGTPSALAQRILHSVGRSFTLPHAVEVKLSCSIGLVHSPEFGPPQRLLACADAAMYAAKRQGGSTFAVFEPRMEHDTREELALQTELREALARNELVLYYQPKMDARSGLITGVEALVRWHHPQRGLVMPGVFIPVAERFGLIGQLGDWVTEEACRQLAEWRSQGLRMRAAINMSAHQLRQDSLLPRLKQAMENHAIDPSQLTIEIIESVLMDDAAVRSFSGLASLGVGLSIDDFGIGYCNFALLRKLPVKQLKVDRSLFTDIQNSADARSVVTAIVQMAHALNLRVVAEGVETERQRDTLQALDCDEMQGFLFARPMPAEKLTLWAMEGETPAEAGGFRPSLFMDADPALQDD
ncbi:putative bifunctional diguanylate cyclase/phosphodiesterase [Ideonella oryzae]|uniref:EAL domain-containing protein n=1 Tax=Ideonella oryzae TaxID=2937441 RepID=A0ABT1BPP3_9BURK|nr:EAL domain-containing protein [Ideonella oryzae]MCO5978200.1 EAL domain-containing protein [Ideonella oryzae]